MAVLYTLVVYLSVPILTIYSLFSKKISAWLKGRKGWKRELNQVQSNENRFNVWFHCASLGEYEQGKPLMKQIRHNFPSIRLYITFFSPSGYEVKKEDPLAFYTGYLPLDTPQNAHDFLKLVRPRLAVFVKSELWPNFIRELHRRRIPKLLISARFHEKQAIFSWKGRLFLNALAAFDFIYVQDITSQKILGSKGISSVVVGDTRFDNVLKTESALTPFPLVERFIGAQQVLMVGSCWEQDLEVICPYVNVGNADIKVVIAPHDVSSEMITYVISMLQVPYILYSQAAEKTDLEMANSKVLLIDNIGILSQLYKYATLAFIGGAFKQGLHNILEPASFGKPVIFGPHFEGFPEAKEMVEEGGGFSVKDKLEFQDLADKLLSDTLFYEETAQKNNQFIKKRTGATEKIMEVVKTLFQFKINF